MSINKVGQHARIRPRSRVSLMAAVGILALVAAGCSSVDSGDGGSSNGDTSQAQSGDSSARAGDTSAAGGSSDGDSTVTISLKEAPDTLDPTFAQTVGARYVFTEICEKLYDINADLTIVPQLASALPQLSSDGLTATIPLRTDAKFNDGTPFDADAVVTTLQRDMTAEGSARKSELSAVKSVEASGNDAVTITLSQPYAPLAAVLADRAGMIMSPKALKDEGNNFGQNPVCVGPYKFVKQISGTEVDMVKSPDYYDADKVHVQNVIMKPIIDATVRAQNFQSGELDIIDRIDPADFPTIKAMDGVTAETVPSLGVDVLELNTAKGPFADPKVRAAFRSAINIDQINTTVYDGLYNSTCQPFPQTSPYFDKDLQCPGYDPAKAKQLLQEAGVTTPIDVDLVMLNDPLGAQRGELIQAQAQSAGFNVKVSPMPAPALISRSSQGDFDGVILTWSGRVDPDGNTSTFVATGGGQNFGKVSDSELDSMLSKAAATSDVDQRKDLYTQAWKLVMDQTYLIPLANPNILTAHHNDVQDLHVFSDGLIRMKNVTVGN